ncbi:hypothetical protein RIF29_21930 [Crotalaria pallida]|uniref:NADP-dependent oxidoreductase domain-containing protein n=1 Tax=Crotalaria pallida TaxID=3830 RepID=A0AAN9I7M0_CROPI
MNLHHDIREKTYRELGIGIVPFSPLGRGFFGGKSVITPADNYLAAQPRIQGENFDKNKILYFRLEKLAEKHGCTISQLALAWLLHQGNNVVPTPGTTKIKNLDSNIGSFKVKLSKDDLREITDAIPPSEVAGDRMTEVFMPCSWKFANTPTKHS